MQLMACTCATKLILEVPNEEITRMVIVYGILDRPPPKTENVLQSKLDKYGVTIKSTIILESMSA